MPKYVDGAGLSRFWDNIQDQIGTASQEQVDAWLDEHPEATTTVQDGAITTAKLADGAVTDAKMIWKSPFPESLDSLTLVQSITMPSGNSGRYAVSFPNTGLYYFDASALSNDVAVRITNVEEGSAPPITAYTRFLSVKAGKVASISLEESGQRYVVLVHTAESPSPALKIYYAGASATAFNESHMLCYERKHGPLAVDMVHRGVATGANLFNTDTTRISTNAFRASGTFTVSLSDYTYGKFSIRVFSEDDVLLYDSGWVSSDTTWTFDGSAIFAVVLSRQNNAAINASDFSSFGLSITPDKFGYYEHPSVDGMRNDISRNEVNSNISVVPTRWKYYYDHLFINKLNGDAVIPSESLFNVQTARRLGFNAIEANVQQTSDGNYVVMHGTNSSSGQTFGNAFYSLGGESIANTLVSSVTLSWIKTNVRYVSTYDKYKVAPPTLQEFLYECRKNGLTAIIGRCYDANVVAIADEIMGKGNYIAYQGERNLTAAPIMHYSSLATVDEIVSQCKYYGAPYMYSMENPMSFTDAELSEIVEAVHSVGCLIGYAACYLNEGQNQRFRQLGFDFAASAWEIPEFETGNICNLFADTDFSDFSHTGTVVDGVLSLDVNDTVEPAQTLGQQFLAGGSLHITFEGAIVVTMGEKVANGFWADDGPRSIWVSSYFLESAPTFVCKGHTGGAQILSIEYKASKF